MDEEPQQHEESGAQDGKAKGKQLKSNGSSVSNTPRKRVSQACDRCRSRKDKCDGKKPVCSTCAAQDQVCSYDPATKKRGLPEGYVRGLEKLWGLTIREIEGIEDNILGILSGDSENASFESLSGVWNDREGLETLLETWRKSRISRELERLLPILDSLEEKSGKRKRPESGPPRPEAPPEPSEPFASQAFGAHQKLPGEIIYATHDDILGVLPQHSPQRRRIEEPSNASLQSSEGTPGGLNLPSTAWHLLDVFFSYTHCWLPIVEKQDVLKVSYQYTPQGINVSTALPGSGDHATLWAILAYAECQNKSVAKIDFQHDTQWTVDTLYKHARSLIPTEDGVFELGHVQALLIMALLNMGRNHWDRAWLLIGQAARIAVNLGLGEVPREPPLRFNPADKKSRSQHVFLGCFALDTLIAAKLGRQPQLRKEDADRIGILEEDGLDEWNPWMDCLNVRRRNPPGPHGPTAVLSTFNQLILLLKILNSVICDSSTGRGRVEKGMELLKELDSWGQVLPAMFATTKPPLLPHRYNLHLAHVSTLAAVYNHISPFSKEMQISELTIVDTFATTARQVMWLLLRQSENFGLLIAPPTYEYFAKIGYESAYKVQDRISDESLTFKDWELNMERCLATMEKTWTTFEDLRKTYPAKSIVDIYQYDTPRSHIQRTESLEMPERIALHVKRPSISNTVLSFSGGLDESPISTRDFMGASGVNFHQPQYDPLFNLAASASMHALEDSSPSWPQQLPEQNIFNDQASADQLRLHEGSVDGDSMFNDFAALDAMEW